MKAASSLSTGGQHLRRERSGDRAFRVTPRMTRAITSVVRAHLLKGRQGVDISSLRSPRRDRMRCRNHPSFFLQAVLHRLSRSSMLTRAPAKAPTLPRALTPRENPAPASRTNAMGRRLTLVHESGRASPEPPCPPRRPSRGHPHDRAKTSASHHLFCRAAPDERRQRHGGLPCESVNRAAASSRADRTACRASRVLARHHLPRGGGRMIATSTVYR